jgi:tRNA threonylcarbamoyl adenosine modification protein YeaZ
VILLNLLAFDTSGSWLTIVLKYGEEIKFSESKSLKRQSDTLMKEIDELLDSYDLSISKIDLIGCVIGPGNFTGLRSGIAVAKAIAFSLSLPVVGLKYFDCFKSTDPVVMIRKARKNWWYASEFDGKGWQCDLLPSEELKKFNGKMIFSEEQIAGIYSKVIEGPIISGYDLVEATLKNFNESRNLYDHISVKPFYVQKPIAEEKVGEKPYEV